MGGLQPLEEREKRDLLADAAALGAVDRRFRKQAERALFRHLKLKPQVQAVLSFRLTGRLLLRKGHVSPFDGPEILRELARREYARQAQEFAERAARGAR